MQDTTAAATVASEGSPLAEERRLPLSQLARGQKGRVTCMRSLDPQDTALLRALGITEETCLTVCRAAGTCVLDVGEDAACRVAVARSIADRIFVGLDTPDVPTPGQRR